MTKSEKIILKEFLIRMSCNVATHGDWSQECIDDNNLEIELYNRLAKIVGLKEMV